MVKQRLLPVVGIVAASLMGVVAVATGQSARSTPSAGNSSLDELLTEVRGLRAEFNQAAGTSIRAQLFVSRLQLQEQRVNTMARQLADVQSRIATLQQSGSDLRRRLAATKEGQNQLPPEDRSDDQVQALKQQIEQGQMRELELRAQESAALGSLSAEQSRWTDFNARLDALERSLPGDVQR